MILNEKEIELFDKKIVIEAYCNYKYDSENIELRFDLYYDCGKGLQSPSSDRETYEFAKKIKNKSGKTGEDLFCMGGNNEYYVGDFRNGKNLVNNEKTRKMLVKSLYAFAIGLDLPIFLQFDENYYLLNELKFTDYSKEDEHRLTQEKLGSLESYVTNNVYGKNYESFKKREIFQKIMRKCL